MKSRSLSDIRKEVALLEKEEIGQLCLKLAKFSTANKELLSYLLFYPGAEEQFLAEVIDDLNCSFNDLNPSNAYLTKKTLRKILRMIKKYAHYTPTKALEIEMRLHFCKRFKELGLLKLRDMALRNIFDRELQKISKLITTLHEDLQYDYQLELEKIAE
jgi:hypothetical protein